MLIQMQLITLFYVLGSGLYIVNFITQKRIYVQIARLLFLPGIIMHFYYLFELGLRESRFPMATVYESMSFLVLFLIILYIVIEFTTHHTSIGSFIFPFILVFQVITMLKLDVVKIEDMLFQSYFFGVHTFTALVGYSAFVFSMILGLMYLGMFHEIKKRRFIFMYDRLPPLEVLDTMNFRSQFTGFLFLTVGIISGIIWAKRAWENFSFFDVKILLSWILWLVYLGSLLSRKFLNWKGKKTAYLSLIGFSIMFFTFVFISIIFSTVHNY